jgi:predicted XRE-type DNA-binding protein
VSQLGKCPVKEEGDEFEFFDVEYECFESTEERFRRFIEGAIQEAATEAHKIALAQAQQEVSDQGCFHKQEWSDSVKHEFYRSLGICLSAFQGAFAEELSQQLDTQNAEYFGGDLEEEEVCLSEPPLELQLAAHLNIMKLNQVQAAAALGVSKMTISQWLKAPGEKGRRRIPKKHEARIRAWIEAE